MSGEIESKDQDTEESQITSRWLKELSLASAHEDKWRKRANKVIDRYRDEEAASENETRKPRFNILYANTEVLRGVLYQKSPVPDVRRRFLDKDKAGRESAQILQRALSFCVDAYDFDSVMQGVVEDYLLPGRGLARVKYIPSYAPLTDSAGQPVMDESGNPQQQVVYETVATDYVEWDMVRISPAKRWEKVRWVAFGELLTRDELKKQFGDDIGGRCTLDWAPKDKEKEDDMFKRALVWTIWDKASKKVHVVSKGMPDQRLSVLDDPLGLQGFFPCPKPVYSIQNTNTMVPVPEYTQYQDQAIELDNLTARIESLTDALRRRGVYDASYPELQKLANAGDNDFIAVENFSNLAEKGGIEKALYEAPIEGIAKVLLQLMQQREAVKQIIYEVTGLADVVRGVSQASETLGAQQLKARYANSRTGPRERAIQAFARDLYRIKAEIIAEKFSAETLAQMTGFDLAMNDQEKAAIQTQIQAAQSAGQNIPAPAKLQKPTWEEIMQILRSDKLRGFRVDIETDSTVQPDAAEEQKNRIELLTGITNFVQGVGPAVQSGAISMDLAKEMLTFGVRAFKVSPQLEDALDSLGGEQNNGGGQQQTKQQAQQQAMEQQFQQAMQVIQEKKQEAEGVIQQAKEVKQQQEVQAAQALSKQAAEQMKAAQAALAEADQREITLAQRETAIRQLQSVVEVEKPDMMQQLQDMHNQVLGMFASLLTHITAPRQRVAIRDKSGKLIGSTETIQEQR